MYRSEPPSTPEKPTGGSHHAIRMEWTVRSSHMNMWFKAWKEAKTCLQSVLAGPLVHWPITELDLDISWYILIYLDISWYILIYVDISWYILILYGIHGRIVGRSHFVTRLSQRSCRGPSTGPSSWAGNSITASRSHTGFTSNPKMLQVITSDGFELWRDEESPVESPLMSFFCDEICKMRLWLWVWVDQTRETGWIFELRGGHPHTAALNSRSPFNPWPRVKSQEMPRDKSESNLEKSTSSICSI